MFSRRSLLALLGAATVDPERLLWEPGKKLISIPNPRVILPTIQYQFVVVTLQTLYGKNTQIVEALLDPQQSVQTIFIAPQHYRIVDAKISISHLGSHTTAEAIDANGNPWKDAVIHMGDRLSVMPVKLHQS